MDQEQHHSRSNEREDYRWMSVGEYSDSHCQATPSTVNDYMSYNNQYTASELMRMEPAPTYGIPRTTGSPYHAQNNLQSLYPLVVPQQWPSMLTSQSNYSTPTLPTASTTTPSSAVSSHSQPTPVRQTVTGGTTPRRTLTDDDRRRMCQYAEDNPGIKQTDIGVRFGVERSTVSKVLRQKEKYLFPHEGRQSPTKKARSKFPDIERALANWARNEAKKGDLTDSMIREKARFFAATVGGNESQLQLHNTTWLERFRQKNHISGNPLEGSSIEARRHFDEDGITVLDSSTTSVSHNATNVMIPLSPSEISPTSIDSSQHGLQREASANTYLDFPAIDHGQVHNHLATRTNTGRPSTTGGRPLLSNPGSPAVGAIKSDTGPISNSEADQPPPLASNTIRPRSQTCPDIQRESDPVPTEVPREATGKVSAPTLAPKMTDHHEKMARSLNHSVDFSKRGGTFSGERRDRDITMKPPLMPKLETVSAVGPTAMSASPTQQEARRALELVMTFFQSQPVGVVEPSEYMTMGKLMQKLELGQSPDGSTLSLPGGLHRIDEEEGQHVTKKRSIRSL